MSNQTVANVIKPFQCNYVAIGVTSVKIIGKYAASGVNYAPKSFIILATGCEIGYVTGISTLRTNDTA